MMGSKDLEDLGCTARPIAVYAFAPTTFISNYIFPACSYSKAWAELTGMDERSL